jgi:hypothetical protein
MTLHDILVIADNGGVSRGDSGAAVSIAEASAFAVDGDAERVGPADQAT